MTIDDKLIMYLEELSNLTLTDDEKAKITADLQQTVESAGMKRLLSLQTDGVGELIQPIETVSVFRDDVASPSFGRDLILQNAPVSNEETFIAPRTVE